jgi:hypothetical protein
MEAVVGPLASAAAPPFSRRLSASSSDTLQSDSCQPGRQHSLTLEFQCRSWSRRFLLAETRVRRPEPTHGASRRLGPNDRALGSLTHDRTRCWMGQHLIRRDNLRDALGLRLRHLIKDREAEPCPS